VTGGVNVGGFVTPGVVGYGAFYVPASQTVQLVYCVMQNADCRGKCFVLGRQISSP
jgi:hypothetical protein